MEKKISRASVLKKLAQLAFGRANDAVKLTLADPELGPPDPERLDLTLLSEIKRGANGDIEVKLMDRLAVIRLLLEALDDPADGVSEAEKFLSVLAQTGAGTGGSDAV